MSRRVASRWRHSFGKKLASASRALAHRTQTKPAPCLARSSAGTTRVAAAEARDLSRERLIERRVLSTGRFPAFVVSETVSRSAPKRTPATDAPRSATSRSTSAPIARSALSPFGHSAMPVPASAFKVTARSYTCASTPTRRSARHVARPPMPAPAMMTRRGGLCASTGSVDVSAASAALRQTKTRGGGRPGRLGDRPRAARAVRVARIGAGGARAPCVAIARRGCERGGLGASETVPRRFVAFNASQC